MKNIRTNEQDKYPTLNRILREKEIDYLIPGNKPLTLRQATAIRNILAPELTMDELFSQEPAEESSTENEMNNIIEMLEALKSEQLSYIKSLVYNSNFALK